MASMTAVRAELLGLAFRAEADGDDHRARCLYDLATRLDKRITARRAWLATEYGDEA